MMVFSLVSGVQEKLGEMLDSEVAAAAAAEEEGNKKEVGIYIVYVDVHRYVFANKCFN